MEINTLCMFFDLVGKINPPRLMHNQLTFELALLAQLAQPSIPGHVMFAARDLNNVGSPVYNSLISRAGSRVRGGGGGGGEGAKGRGVNYHGLGVATKYCA